MSNYNSKAPTDGDKSAENSYFTAPPSISLPKGGGAIKGMGEKFAANPVMGTGSMSIPIATSPGRSGFGPQLSLSYDSGAGNGIFGLGWNLSLPSITRKTDKGLPRYWDAEESDVFILSGAEDLVPVLKTDGTVDEPLRDGYRIRKYRPRIEGLFALIERWTNTGKPTDVFWRTISKDNITTWYGKTEVSRIFDPSDKTHIFSWSICESYDDKGNAIVYEYQREDDRNVVASQANERNRSRSANHYLKRIFYGNHQPYPPSLGVNTASPSRGNCYFEVVFDYGEHDKDNPNPLDSVSNHWSVRQDPFSNYRAGFEVRTYRLCQRVLMFHHIPNLRDGTKGYEGAVRSTDFTYSFIQSPDDIRYPIYSRLVSVTQTGYKQGMEAKSLPPLEFTYSEPNIDETVREVDPASLENLPQGLDGSRYQWVDLDGEGLSGILTEQGNGWFYKRNPSPINAVLENGKKHVEAQFAPLELVASQPVGGLANGAQFLDLAGNGKPDLVTMRGAVAGFYERTHDEGWESFIAFKSLPVLDWDNPNLKFIDLDGDGHSDILITEDNCFVWHLSLAEEGFGAAERVYQPWDEEQGPRVVFADSTQSIYLADMSGDGLTDIVRIRNGEVCYWANLGYGRFGSKVTMDNAPWFDMPDIFNQRRIQLADIDGSGTTDILYFSSEGVQVYFNQSGNGWSAKRVLRSFPAIDSVASVTVVDLLGNGTACLVWSSPLPGNGRRVMRYIDLMGGQKPHLLIKTVNNLGAETVVDYAPSTKFYLQDRLAGKPWITKLPFPVHVVEKVTVFDKWRNTSFASTYSYHHGYFDGIEREFRGFGRVEQTDVENYGVFAAGNVASPYISNDKKLYQPPVKTITWFHTGAFFDRDRILNQFQHEYFAPQSESQQGSDRFIEHSLPEPDLADLDLSAEEWREALRACKGLMLRQEVYELDVDALTRGDEQRVKLFSTAYHNCHMQRLQHRGTNRHAVFLVTESEAITYHYELDLRSQPLRPDPRIAHTLNLRTDRYGNVLEAAAIAYPRIGRHPVDAMLPSGTDTLIAKVQQETHLVYTENRFTTADPATANDLNHHRLPLPCEVKTYEVTGRFTGTGFYFTLAELRDANLGSVAVIDYHRLSDAPNIRRKSTDGIHLQKRCVEQVRMLYFSADLQHPLEWGIHNHLGLPFETYKLALTDDLLTAVLGGKLTAGDRSQILNQPNISGYFSGSDLAARFPSTNTTGQYWIRSGIAGFASVLDAAKHFYLPERYIDPFGNPTTLIYDSRDLYIQSSTDVLGNTTEVTKFDFRVLAPREMKDVNGNLSEIWFDVLGMPVAMAVKGKGAEGDRLDDFSDALANPNIDELSAFFTDWNYDEKKARDWLKGATARHVYYFGEVNQATKVRWGVHPPCAFGILREQHGEENSPMQVAFEYSDGGGNVLMKKAIAEPAIASEPSGEPAQRAIDNFSTGTIPTTSYAVRDANDDGYRMSQSGSMVGGNREFHLVLRGQSGKADLEINPTVGLRLTTDSGVAHSLGLTYGTNPTPEYPMPIDLSAYNALRFRFSTVPIGLVYCAVSLLYAMLQVFIPPQATSYDLIVGFDQLAAIAAPNHSIDFSQVYRLRLETGGIVGSEFTLTSIAAVSLPRWVTSGKTILNNKGKAVKQYEPYFTNSHRFEEPLAVGVTPIAYYDAAGRLVRTELPDGTFSRVEFSPWQVKSFDANDTVLDSQWYADRQNLNSTDPEARAARMAQGHANTPSETILDSLGREVITIAHNRTNGINEKYVTFTKLDAEGKPLWIRDARGSLVMQYVFPYALDNRSEPQNYAPCYDIAGNLLFQHSMDAGDRWMLMDAMGKPMLAWDEYKPDEANNTVENRRYFTEYDALHRPTEQWLTIDNQPPVMVERYEYQDGIINDPKNMNGQLVSHYDPSGLVETVRRDFKGNVLEVKRRMNNQPKESLIDWKGINQGINPDAKLVSETFTQRTEYDAMNRMKRQENWHLANRTPAIYTPQYNLRGILVSETLSVRGQETKAILNIEYDAKGQRTRIQYGNGTTTRYYYDPTTFRLVQLRTTLTSPGERLPTQPSNLNNPNVLQNIYYTYDPVGNITEILDDAYEPVFFNNQIVEPRNTYTYDALYRLIEATGRENYSATNAPDRLENSLFTVNFPVTDRALRKYYQYYTYDAVGNIMQMRHVANRGDWTRNYEYATDSNRLKRTLTNNLNKNVEYLYDSHGSMLNLANVSEGYRLRWDYRDMIRTIDLGGGGEVFYNYDTGKQRTRKLIERNNGGKTVEERLYLGGMELYRRWTGNKLDEENPVEEIETYHLFAGDQRVLIVEDVMSTNNPNLPDGVLFRYQYSNHLGSVGLEMTGDSNNPKIISYEEYHPYGTTAYRATNAVIKTTAKRYRYTGMERDEESGLAYHGARYLQVAKGRWISCDPTGLKDGLCLYSYCQSNPVSRNDRNGEQSGGFWETLGGYFVGAGESFASILEIPKEYFNYFYEGMLGVLYSEGKGTNWYQDSIYRNGYQSSIERHASIDKFFKTLGEQGAKMLWSSLTEPLDAAMREIDNGNAPMAGYQLGRFVPSFMASVDTFWRGGNSAVSAIEKLSGKTAQNFAPSSVPQSVNSTLDMESHTSNLSMGTTDSLVQQQYLKSQGAKKVSQLAWKSYWNLQEILSAAYLERMLGLTIFREVPLYEKTSQGITNLGRRLDALILDVSTGRKIAAEWSTDRNILLGKAKYAQLDVQISAFSRAQTGKSSILAALQRPGAALNAAFLESHSFLDISDAEQILGTYPHWNSNSVSAYRGQGWLLPSP
jgi:RHS repeat-associated protein